MLGTHPDVGPSEPQQAPEEAPGFHSVLLAEPEPESTEPARPLRSLFLEGALNTQMPLPENPEDASGTPTAQQSVPSNDALASPSKHSVGGSVRAELLKAAKPTPAAMALVAPIVSDLVQELFHDCFNPALFPREPQPNGRPRTFTEAEDE